MLTYMAQLWYRFWSWMSPPDDTPIIVEQSSPHSEVYKYDYNKYT